MTSAAQTSRILRQITQRSHNTTFDVGGPRIEFLTPAGSGDEPCIIKGIIAPGEVVPLHSHPEPAAFYVISGVGGLLALTDDGLGWNELHRGDYAQIADSTPHAWRNTGDVPFTALIVTTARLGQALREMGAPSGASAAPVPPDMARLAAVAARHRHWLASPAENAAVGITLPDPAAAL
jgi:quercetin dioxygenase-like cupin family protein